MVDVSRFPKLGLGLPRRSTASEPEVTAPSEMVTVADSRTFRNMNPFFSYREETEPLHGKGYNILFADGHVLLVKRKQYLYPPLAAHNWNRDNQPHPEFWRATNEWAIKN